MLSEQQKRALSPRKKPRHQRRKSDTNETIPDDPADTEITKEEGEGNEKEDRPELRLKTQPHPERYLSSISHEVLDRYYAHNDYFISQHHLHSYNEFLQRGLRATIRSMNADFRMLKDDNVVIDGAERSILRTVRVTIGGDDEASGLYVDRPVIVDAEEESTRLMFPNEARLRGMTYACNVYCDIRLDFYVDGISIGSKVLERFRIGLIPLMLHSDMCVLHGQPREVLREMGECVYDQGGYFIIGGNEKVLVSRESLVYNRLFVNKPTKSDEPPYIEYEGWVRAVEPDGDLFPKTVKFYVYKRDAAQKRNAIDVQLPKVKGKVPLFVVFRALGLESDRAILDITLGDHMNEAASTMTSVMRSCAIAAANVGVFDQMSAARYLVERTDYKTPERMKQILVHDFFPNAGKTFDQKLVYLAFVIGKLLRMCAGVDPLTDRDTYEHKRVNVSGVKIAALFRDMYARFRKVARNRLDSEYYISPWRRRAPSGGSLQEVTSDIMGLVNASNARYVFDASIIEEGVMNSFRGAWNEDETNPGQKDEYAEKGVVQELGRVSYLSYLSHVRRVVWPGEVAKMKQPHMLYATHWGAVCPVESPDGPNIGITKHMATHCHITGFANPAPLVQHLSDIGLMRAATLRNTRSTAVQQQPGGRAGMSERSSSVRVIVNDILEGATTAALALSAERYLVALRRVGLINPMTSVRWEVLRGELIVFTDAGRCTRPLLITDHTAPPEEPGHTDEPARLRRPPNSSSSVDEEGRMQWRDMLLGRLLTPEKKDELLARSTGVAPSALHPDAQVFATHAAKSAEDVPRVTALLNEEGGILEFIDVEETNVRLIAMAPLDLEIRPCQKYTHCEIHPASALSVPATVMPFMDRNAAARNVLSMAQSKQSMGLPFTNFGNRMDAAAAVLHYPQRPIVTTSFAHRLCDGNLAYGENLIVAIATFTGYNQEDAVIINQAAIQRGAFNTSHYHAVYFEESSTNKERIIIANPTLDPLVDFGDERAVGKDVTDPEERARELCLLREERAARFAHIQESGLPREGTYVKEGDVLIGRIHVLTEHVQHTDSVGFSRTEVREIRTDASEIVERSTAGNVDRVFMSGGRGKVRIRQVRVPEFGDKVASRAAQKGIIGMVMPAAEMPFSAASGIVPDLIINPHAMPSRMTVAHLLECALAKSCVVSGRRVMGDTFEKTDVIQELLDTDYGFQKHGEEVMYNGRTGEQVATSIFIGPTYYMRLKHMIADKINHRSTGPVTAITRQPNKGRGRHGGLRIGEMEQQALQSHGVAAFMKECFMEKSDGHWMDIDADEGIPVAYSNEKTKTRVAFDTDNVDIRRIQVPFSWKVMQQELQGIGIDMRLLLDEDVDDDYDESHGLNAGDTRTRIHALVRDVLHNGREHLTYENRGDCVGDDDGGDKTGATTDRIKIQAAAAGKEDEEDHEYEQQQRDGEGRGESSDFDITTEEENHDDE
jgi:DNA-directed RNA polymerase II subunit RPB2